MAEAVGVTREEVAKSAGGAIPDLSGDIRHLVPVMGLRNYWYPAIAARRIPKRHPVQVRMLGEELCLFRGAQGQAVAIRDSCPHRAPGPPRAPAIGRAPSPVPTTAGPSTTTA